MALLQNTYHSKRVFALHGAAVNNSTSLKISSNGKSHCTGRSRKASHESNSKHSKASNGLRMVNLRREKGKDESSKMPNIMVKSERSK